jgi:hypothetical protein
MQNQDWRPPPSSYNALFVFTWLYRRGGSVRIRPLLRWSGLTCDELCAAVNELQERGWVLVAWRTLRSDLPARVREVDRVTITHQGRLFAPRLWLVR